MALRRLDIKPVFLLYVFELIVNITHHFRRGIGV